MKTLSIACLSLMLLAAENPPGKTDDSATVHGDGGAVFTHSQVATASGRGYMVTSEIANQNTADPLSASWKDGALGCTGTQQIEPGGKCTHSRYLPDASLIRTSTIKYGAQLNYATPAQAYVQPQSADSSAIRTEPVITEVVRTGSDGATRSRITVTSALGAARDSADMTIALPQGWSIAVPSSVLANVTYVSAPGRQTSPWKPGGSGNPSQPVPMSNPTLAAAAAQWLATPGSPQTGVTLLDYAGGPNAPIRFRGTQWALRQVPMVGISPDRSGTLTFVAGVYMPRF